jgi:sulfite exporter TauE/SafE
MCGGIATGFSSVRAIGGWWVAAQPNLGRVLGYAAAGALAGGFGSGILAFARMDALRVGARVLVGLVLVVTALRLLDRRGRLAPLARPGARLWQWLRPLQQRLLPANTVPRRMALGVLWGWLPCGLSTSLLAAAWLQADARNGALTMLAFGLGTLPVMLPLTWSGARIGQRLQRGGWRMALGSLVLGAGLLTLSAPWLMQVPRLHGWLSALGCQPGTL